MVDRNPRVLRMARGRRCLLQLPGCLGGGETVVAAHSNSQAHGKGMGIKAGDQWSVWACGPCHALLDQGGLTRREQQDVFAQAHERQMTAWGRVAADPHEASADREAARWAARKARMGGHYDCGHYRSTGSAPHLRFHEDNAHAQRKQCNRWGAGRAVDYRLGLIERIGLARVEALEADQEPRKYTADELRAIRDLYRAKLRDLVKERANG